MESRGEISTDEYQEQVQRLSNIPASTLQLLADADAFGSIPLRRREAFWQSLELTDDEFPLFDTPSPCPLAPVSPCLPPPDEPAVTLPIMPLGQEVLTDYSTSGLSLKRCP